MLFVESGKYISIVRETHHTSHNKQDHVALSLKYPVGHVFPHASTFNQYPALQAEQGVGLLSQTRQLISHG